jgi:hypothetical protein
MAWSECLEIWYETIARFLEEQGLRCIDADYSMFTDGTIYVAPYVDDLLIIGPSIDTINELKEALNHRFKFTDLGPCSYYLGMTITRDRAQRTLWLSQAGYLENVLSDYNLKDANPVANSDRDVAPTHGRGEGLPSFLRVHQAVPIDSLLPNVRHAGNSPRYRLRCQMFWGSLRSAFQCRCPWKRVLLCKALSIEWSYKESSTQF